MDTLIYILLLICGAIVPAVFAVCGLFFLACAFAQCSEAWECRQKMHSSIDAMASEISRQALRLDEVRLDMFLLWLKNRGFRIRVQSPRQSQLACPSSIRRDLETNVKQWLESFPVSGQLWEYRLMLSEISWWRDLDNARLTKIMLDCSGNDS